MTVFLLATGTLLSADPTAGQTTNPSVSLTDFSAPDPYTVDGDQRLQATIQNDEAFPVSGVVGFYHPDTSTDGNRFAQTTFDVGADTTKDVTIAWDGRVFGAPLRGAQTIHALLSLDGLPAPEDDHASLTLTFKHHGVDVTLDPPGSTLVAPGATITQAIRVTNTGNTADNFTLSLAEGAPGWTFTLEELGPVEIDAGSHETVTLFVTAPATGAPGDEGRVDVTARPVGYAHVADTTPSSLFEVAPRTDFLLTIDPADQIAEAGDQVEFTIHAENTGNEPVELDLAPAASDATMTGTSVSEPFLLLDVGAEDTFSASATLPADIQAGNYLVAVAATNETSGLQRHAYGTVHVPRIDDVTLVRADGETNPLEVNVAPGTTETFPILVENAGNAFDTFQLTVDDVPTDWTISAAAASAAVPPGEDETVTFDVTVPAEAPAGTHGITVRAASTAAPEAPDATMTATIDVPAQAVAAIEAQTDRRPITAGQSVEFPLTIRNDGNTEAEFTLPAPTIEAADPAPADWTVEWLDDASITLGPGDEDTATVKVTAPATVDDASYAIMHAETTPDDGVPATKVLTVQTPMVDLAVDAIRVPDLVDADEDTTMVVRIANVGTADLDDPVTLIVNATLDDETTFEQTFTVDELPATPGDDHVDIDVAWTPDEAGTYLIQAVVDPDDEVQEKSGDDVEADGSNNNATTTVFVRVEDVVVTSPATHTGAPGQRILVEGEDGFRIRNLGNVDATVTLTTLAVTPEWNAIPLATHLAVGPGATADVPLVIDIPDAPGPGAGNVQTTLVADGDEWSGLLVVEIDDPTAPSITDVTVDPATALTGSDVTVAANITDATSVAWAHATITTADGTQERVPLSPVPGEGPRWTGSYEPTTPGTHRVTVTTGDAADPANIASTQSDSIAFDVTLDPTPPTIVFTSPATEADAIRPAAGVNFTVSDLFGVKNLSYAVYDPTNRSAPIANDTLSANGPYHIPVAGLSEDSYVVVVRAENIYGIHGEANRTFRLDATPPPILNVQANAIADGGYSVLAQVAPVPDLHGARLEVTTSGQTLHEFPMNATETFGDFTTAVPSMDNITTWRLIAWDEAGNLDIREFNVTGQTGQRLAGGSSPGLGVVAVTMGLLAIAFVRRD